MQCNAISYTRSDLEELIHRDPGGRGVASFLFNGAALGTGQLAAAAHSLASSARAVAIVTGFAVHDGQAYVAETDGPPGALALADVLLHHGVEVALVSDSIGMSALAAGCRELDLSPRLLVFQFKDEDAWIETFLQSDFGRRLTHLLSIERVGPSHTLESLAAQPREGPPPLEEFEREVPPEHRDVCHNMRGVPIGDCTAKTHRLFEIVQQRRLPITTIGIGDGGNELGMGQFPWEVLRAAIAQGPAGRVVCRIATDLAIVAGVSNWGGYALAAAIDSLRGSDYFPRHWNAERERRLLEALIRESGCVDGVTRRCEPTVDGLSAEVLSAFWRDLLSRQRH
jgi:hypothetical protein